MYTSQHKTVHII